MMRPALVAALLLSTSAPALADDESSEHTAELVGESSDTLGVTVAFDDKAGWSMTVRAKPGADAKTFQIALPKRHAHYLAYVTPGRTAIAFIEISAGIDKTRDKITAKDKLAWVWSPDGKLVRTWTYGQVFGADPLANMQRSVGHVSWLEAQTVTKAGLELKTHGGKRTIVLDTKAGALR